MAYQCKCGNKEEFLEVFDIAVDIVDGNGQLIEFKDRNVAYYVCKTCESEIPYTDFQPLISTIAGGELPK